MPRVAAIDCGTNSLRLLIADVDAITGTLVDHVRDTNIVRLGQGVDRTRRFSAEALDRTFTVARQYAARIEEFGVTAVRFVATSASRDATNREEFFDGVRSIFGVEPEVISGVEEAALSFAGATHELTRKADTAPPYLVVDIGGGSTEFVIGSGTVDAARSVDVGCVRLTERHLHDDPPRPEQVAAARADVVQALDDVEQALPLDRARTLVGLAGSVTTVAGIALELDHYDPARIHHSRIAAGDVRRIARRLLAMTRSQRAALPVMHEGRADVIGAGALILDAIMERLHFGDVVVSEHDILDGIAAGLASSS